jgi:hypothetical protein
MSRLPFEINWDLDLWAWLTGDSLRKPTYRSGRGHWPVAWKTRRRYSREADLERSNLPSTEY